MIDLNEVRISLTLRNMNKEASKQKQFLRYYGVIAFTALLIALSNYTIYTEWHNGYMLQAIGASTVLLIVILSIALAFPIIRYLSLGAIFLTILLYNGIYFSYGIHPLGLLHSLFDTNWNELSNWFHWSFIPILFLTGTSVWGYIHILKKIEPQPVKKIQSSLLAKGRKAFLMFTFVYLLTCSAFLGLLRFTYFHFFPFEAALAQQPVLKATSWYPLSIIYDASVEFIQYYYTETSKLKHLRSAADFESSILDNHDELIFVFIIGETTMSSHSSLNSYSRLTMPMSQRQSKNIVSYPKTLSFGHMTNTSIVGMFTDAEINNPAPHVGSFTDLFTKHGFQTLYMTSGGEMRNQNILMRNLKKKEFHSAGDVFEAVSPSLDDKKVLYVLYTEGSHFPYKKRYPQEWSHFQPDNHSSYPPGNSPEVLINAYDNSILYMDYLLARLFERLKNRRAIVFFAGDHGELLGENGLYGRNEDENLDGRKPLIFVWMSNKYLESRPEVIRNMRSWMDGRVTHDYIFHTSLGLAGIISPVYKKKLDLTQKKEPRKKD